MFERINILDIVNGESNLTNYDDIVDTELQDNEIWDDSSNDYEDN
jgi:hypothetical protein